MPVFQYEPYRNAYGPSIAEALQHEGNLQAAAALQQGDLQAEAIRQRGADTARMWGTLGNAVTAIPQQMRANREAARRDELQGMQLDAARREQKTRQVLEQELGNPQNYYPDGRLNEGQVLPRLQQLDLGAYQHVAGMVSKSRQDALTQTKTLQDLALGGATLDEKAAKRSAESQENLGKAAFTAGQELQPDQPLQGRDYATQLVNRAVASGTVRPEDANQFYLALARAKPDEVGAILQGATAPDLRAKIEKEQAEAQRAQAEAGRIQREGLEGKPLTGDERIASLFGRRAAGETLNAADMAALVGWEEKEGRKPTTVRTVDANGRPVELHMTAAEALRRGSFQSPPTAAQGGAGLAGGEPVAVDATRPTGPSANLPDKVTGQTPNAVYQNALNYAMTGRVPSMGLGANPRAKATRDAIFNKAAAMADAAGVDLPTVQAEYRANAGTLAKLLPQATATASAANAAIDNLDLALKQSATVGRPDSKMANRYLQWAQGELTEARGLTKFETYVYTAAREYAKVTSGGAASAAGLSDTAAREASKLLNTGMSQGAFEDAVGAMKDDMTNVTRQQTRSLAGVSQTIANLFATAHGMSAPPPADRTPGAVGGPPPPPPSAGPSVRMQAPNGQVKVVSPDQVDYYKSLGAVVVR